MKKYFLLFLAIFIFLIIPNNVSALSLSVAPSNDYAIIYRYYGNGDTLFIGSTGALVTNPNSSFYQSRNYPSQIYYEYNNLRYPALQTTVTMPQDRIICTDNCDVTVEFDYGIFSASSNSNALLFMTSTVENVAIRFVKLGTTGNFKFYCTATQTDSDLMASTKYIKAHAVCKTSNINYFTYVDFDDFSSVNFTSGDNFWYSWALWNLQIETSAYTGTQDSDSNPIVDDNISDDIINNQIETNEKLDEINDTMKDDNIDTSYQNSTLDNLNNQMASNNVISDLLLLPVTLYQKILSSLNSSSCTPFTLGTLYGHELTFPCVNVSSYVGTAIWTTIDLICSGVFIFGIRKKFVDIFNNMTNLKDGGNEIE